MAKRTKQSQPLATAIESVVGRMDRGGSGYRKALIVSAWERVAGDQIAAHAHGAFLKDDELLVFMDSPVWATEMQAMAESFRVAINEEIGREAVGSLRFTVSKRPARAAYVSEDSASKPDTLPVQLPELEQAEKQRIEDEAREVTDPRLREALVAARTAAERRKKGLESRNAAQGPPEDLREPQNP